MTNPLIENVTRELSENRAKELKEMILYYGDKTFFKERKKEGYTQVQFGSGHWFNVFLQTEKFARFIESKRFDPGPIERARVLSVWIAYHPNGTICTFEKIKVTAYGWNQPGPSLTTVYIDQGIFDQFLRDFEIELVPEKFSLAELIKLARF